MKKYLVDVYLPAIGQHYDAYLPAERRVHEVTQLLVEIAEKLSDGAFAGTADTMLLDAFSGEILRSGATIYEAGIRNASHLILI